MSQLITVSQLDNNLFKIFKYQFDKSLSSLTLSQPLNYPYIYYQSLSIQNYLVSTTQRIISIYSGNVKVLDVIINKNNIGDIINLFKPTLYVICLSAIYAFVQSVSQYGIEKVGVFVKDKSLSLIINVKDNSKKILNEIVEFLNKVQNDINEKLINISLIIITFFILYKSITL